MGGGWRAAIVAVLVGLLCVPAMSADAAPPVTVYAHRGGSGLAPENTLGAFRSTHQRFGADGVWLEMDTQLSADGVLVVMHDDTLDRTTDCAGEVGAHTAAELAACDAGQAFPGWPAFEPVPALEQVLVEGRHAGWRVMVEIKDIPGESNFDPGGTTVADALVALVTQTAFPVDRLIVQSFWPLALDRVELRAPTIRTALLTPDTLPAAPKGVGIPVVANAAYSTVRQYEISAPSFETVDANPTVVALAQALGREVVVWTPNTDAEITRALATGVDGIISDNPDRALAAVAGQ